MKLRLIHGIHSPEGANNMSALLPHMQKALPDADISLFQYGFMGFWQARFNNNKVAKELMRLSTDTTDEEVWVTHSNGAAIAYLAVEMGAKPVFIININPALDRWLTPDVARVEVYYADNDRWVNLSQWLPFHIWGDQGRVGYKGSLKNTISINASHVNKTMAYKDHNGLFASDKIARWASFFAYRIIGDRRLNEGVDGSVTIRK